MTKSGFGKKLQQIRKAKNLTQTQLAEKAGINEKHISKIETGIYFPSYTTLERLLNALDLKIEDIGLNSKKSDYKDNIFYTKSLQILNKAATEQELEFYYGILRQAQKCVDNYQNSYKK